MPLTAEDVVYELFVRNFTPEGTLRAAAQRLEEVRGLGTTVVWLMPVQPVGKRDRKGGAGSPYAIRDYCAVDPSLGSMDDLTAFVNRAHALGLKVIVDLVANHTAADHPWVEEFPGRYRGDGAGLPVVPPGTDWTDVRDLDYGNPEVRRLMADVMRFWTTRAGMDGFRCDVAELVPLDFWKDTISALRSSRPLIMLAEGDDPALFDVGFDSTYSWAAYRSLKAVFGGAPATRFGTAVSAEWDDTRGNGSALRFVTNHDETAWDAPPPVLFHTHEGARAAAVALLLLPGPALLYNGQEVGVEIPTPLLERGPIDWTDRRDTRSFYRNLLTLRNAVPAFLDGDLAWMRHDRLEDVVAYSRTSGVSRAFVVANVRSEAREVAIQSLPTELRQLTGPARLDAGRVALPAYGYGVFLEET